MVAVATNPTAVSAVSHPLATVLLAEDDPSFRDLVSCFLRRRGYRVLAVGDGGALLEQLGGSSPYGVAHPIDLIVSDIFMPVADGMRILRGLHEARRPIPTILMTAFGDDETHAEARRNGAYAVLDKPFELGVLLGVVDRALFGA